MFRKILIANRGEIACRIIRTCWEMDIATVAVYSDADAAAKHVADADEAVHIGAAPAVQSYLDTRKIIDAALKTGAEAIHPGYGFLSENPEFVEAVEAAGLVFIGPSASAIRSMGLKDAAKRLMADAGVPVVPGYHDLDQDPDRLREEARGIGFPVMIKARAGGGGKGMRLVEAEMAFDEALLSARREAEAAFGDGAVLIEKYITNPRHIEVQIFGDSHGHAVHLFERDCSLQRRHQKVIEEAPAPGMTDAMRKAMGDAAVRAALAIDYAGAGTVEFIVDTAQGLRPDGFWFMEMNTRLQVEHPVTELITGLDLVEWQLRIAAGEVLPRDQSGIAIDGHAMEARIYAEDAARDFLPATGTLTHVSWPKNARSDTGVRSGDDISPYYDPMVAKVIVHGPDRETALSRLTRALQCTEIAGTVTNLTFLTRLSANTDFVNGDVETGLIQRAQDGLTRPQPANAETLALAAVAAANLERADGWETGFALWSPLRQTITLVDDGVPVPVSLEVRAPGDILVTCHGLPHDLRFDGVGVTFDGKPATCRIVRHSGGCHVFGNEAFEVIPHDPLKTASSDGRGGDETIAPMSGLVRAVLAAVGSEVVEGDPLIVMEAMKMEHTLRAPRDGKIARINAETGDRVDDGAVLVELEPS